MGQDQVVHYGVVRDPRGRMRSTCAGCAASSTEQQDLNIGGLLKDQGYRCCRRRCGLRMCVRRLPYAPGVDVEDVPEFAERGDGDADRRRRSQDHRLDAESWQQSLRGYADRGREVLAVIRALVARGGQRRSSSKQVIGLGRDRGRRGDGVSGPQLSARCRSGG